MPDTSRSAGVDGGDSADLSHFGYQQELKRAIGSFAAFSAGFAYLAILTGTAATFGIAYAFAGPGMVWTWPVVFAGQLCVALCFAELATHYPLSGSVYQFVKRVAGRAWAWNTSWIYIVGILITLTTGGLALQNTLTQISPDFQLIGDQVPGIFDPEYAQNAIILQVILLAFVMFVNIVGVRLLATLCAIGVACELVGAVGLVLILIPHISHGPGALFETLGTGSGHEWGYLGALLIAAFLPLYTFYGFDTASSLAEETENPRFRAPRAVVRAIVAAGVLGFLLIVFAVMAVDDLADPLVAEQGLPYIVTSELGDTIGKIFLVDVAIAVVTAYLAVMALMARILFGMARDNELPASRIMSHVSPRTGTPVAPVLVAGVLAIAILTINLANPEAFQALISIAIGLSYVAYLGVTLPLLRQRRAGWPANVPTDDGPPQFSLGRWGMPINVAAVVWGAIGLVTISWPRAEFLGDAWYQQYAAVIFLPLVLAIGCIYYYGWHRRRPAVVISEHASAGGAPE